MPSENYVMGRDGHLIWSWEHNGLRMEKSSVPRKPCKFCGKDVRKRPYRVKTERDTYITCSGCKFVFDYIYKEHQAGNKKAMDSIFRTIKNANKHCRVCRHFNHSDNTNCRRHYFTGCGSHGDEYPNSFANHGCADFTLIE